ncbi:hypothetical protein PSTG_02043 [Puccinia striiformis f. sp. tritici PST-78]|uniref:Uncharacterized protein n=1 Tax=Puccinia striiformis f. sp. tritici PST-78 TaxID=1165861 RepID=A0A0L0W0F5_9BASI|nr:hypothetical protein PSTG_02043 [Puccinia striiformis f. sp. tritici PST-78]
MKLIILPLLLLVLILPYTATTQQHKQSPNSNIQFDSIVHQSNEKDEIINGHSTEPPKFKSIINQSDNDPLNLSSSKPTSRKKKLPILESIQKLTKSIFILLTTKNPIWSISFQIIKNVFYLSFHFSYVILSTLFGFLNQIMIWFWDEILSPMTYPIRLVYYMIIVQPINLTIKILNKLKPVIFYLISAITVGILIGVLGSRTHLFIGDLLFPITNHRLEKKKKLSLSLTPSTKKNIQEKNRSEDSSSITKSKPSTQRIHTKLPRSPAPKKIRFPREEDTSSETEILEDEEEDTSKDDNLDTELPSNLTNKSNRMMGYTSSVEDRPTSSSTRHRHQTHKIGNLLFPSTSPSKTDKYSPSSTDLNSSILKNSTPLNSPTVVKQNLAKKISFDSLTNSRKKKVTFKTD